MRRALLLMLAVAASPATADGPAICAVEQSVTCPRFDECERSLPAAINLPTLFRLDPDAKVIESRLDDGTVRSSPMSAVVEVGGTMLLHGTDNDLPWTMTVAKDNGALTLVVAGANTGYVAFGVCSRALAR